MTKKRQITNGVYTITDRDVYFRLVRLSDGLRVTIKPSREVRENFNAGTFHYFEKLLDRALEAKAGQKYEKQKQAERIAEIKEAAAKGIPIERVTLETGRSFVRVMPWYRRLWSFLKKPISLRKAPAGTPNRHPLRPIYLGLLDSEDAK